MKQAAGRYPSKEYIEGLPAPLCYRLVMLVLVSNQQWKLLGQVKEYLLGKEISLDDLLAQLQFHDPNDIANREAYLGVARRGLEFGRNQLQQARSARLN